MSVTHFFNAVRDDRETEIDMALAGVAILPADGRSLPYADGWRVIRSIRPAGPRPMLLWLQVRDGLPDLDRKAPT